MTWKQPPSLYLLAFVFACAVFIIARTPGTTEESRQIARAVSQKLLDEHDAGRPGITTSGEFVGIGTRHPDAALHVVRKHPDLLKLQNTSKGGSSWVFQIGSDGWQDGNLTLVSRPDGKHAFVVEPKGKVVFLGDVHVAGKLTAPQAAAGPATVAALQERVEALTKIVEELVVRVGELEPDDASVVSPATKSGSKR
jgi:hypothetical protein